MMMMMMMMNRTKKPTTSRKSKRTRTKKPKFVSLVQLGPKKLPQQPRLETSSEKHHQQLNLFPLHPDHDHDHDQPNMAHLFSAADGDGGATSITSLLGSDDNNFNVNTSLSSSVSPESDYYPCGGAFQNFSPSSPQNVRTGPAALVRTALRSHRGREESEDRWVSYSQVVEKRPYEEVTSCCDVVDNYQKQKRRNITTDNSSPNSNSLALKLDYNEIMDAWSDRGPLYIHEKPSLQIVPDDQSLLANHDTTSNDLQDESVANDTWRVPEMSSIENVSNGSRVVAVGEEEYYWKIEGQRQASILRYKEKRQNRLFAKRIRYQVRKLNAEKRPRVKGRFVKRD